MSGVATVLLVDDDSDMRALLRAALARNEHFEVIGDAPDGESALKLVQQTNPDIVILDLGLPDIAGRDVLTRLRAGNREVRVVVFTGSESETQSSLSELGAAGFVVKGENFSRLISVLEDVVVRDVEVVTIELDQDPTSVGRARRFTEERLSHWGADELAERGVLVVSELVTNAIVHGGSRCRLSLRWRPGSLRVEVADFGSGSPEPQAPSTVRPGGRGLMIVSSVSAAWGIDPADIGKIVWAEIAA